MPSFKKNIQPLVEHELKLAHALMTKSQPDLAFEHLENAHVLGQNSTLLHVRVHWRMLLWGFRQHSAKEIIGQVFRIIGAATKTAFGLVPQGNTGGANVSPFRPMPMSKAHEKAIKLATDNTKGAS